MYFGGFIIIIYLLATFYVMSGVLGFWGLGVLGCFERIAAACDAGRCVAVLGQRGLKSITGGGVAVDDQDVRRVGQGGLPVGFG